MKNQVHDISALTARLGVSRSMLYKLWQAGALKSVKIGARRFSTERQIEEFLAGLESGDAA